MPTFRSVKRRHLRRPARWRASCTACDSSIVLVGWTIPEEDGADSRRERLRGAIWFEGRRRCVGCGNRHWHVHKTNHSREVRCDPGRPLSRSLPLACSGRTEVNEINLD